MTNGPFHETDVSTEARYPHLILGPEWTKTVEITKPDYCTCDITQGTWKLYAEGGYTGLTHSVCNRPLLSDLMEDTVLDGHVEVILTPSVENCQCQGTCDCTVWLVMKGTS